MFLTQSTANVDDNAPLEHLREVSHVFSVQARHAGARLGRTRSTYARDRLDVGGDRHDEAD